MSDTAVIFSILAQDKTKGAFKSVGKGLAELFAGKEILDFGKESIQAAAEMQKTQARVKAVFGESAEAVNKWAEAAATGSGLSADAADKAASQFGLLGTQAGLSGDKLSSFAIANAKLGADLASFNGSDPASAQEALTKAYGGSVKALKPYGVLLDQAAIKQEAVKLGIIKTTKDALTPQQKVLAIQGLVMAQTGKQQGNFAKSSGDLQNQQKVLTAEFENAKDKLGTGLLPVVTKFATVLVGVIGFVEAHSSWLTPLIAGIAAVVAGLKVWSVVQELLNIELDANPIGAIILAIVALVAIIVVAVKWHKQIEAVAKVAWHTIQAGAMAVWNWLKSNWPYLLGILTGPIGLAAAFIYKHWDSVVAFVKKLPGRISSAAVGMWDGIKNAFRAAINWVIRGWDALHFSIPGFSFLGVHVGGFNLGLPQIPQLAAGAIIRARPGGTLAVLGEGRNDEAVVPLPRGGATAGLGGQPCIHIYLSGSARALMTDIAAEVRGSFNGDVQVALGGHA